MAKKVKNKKQEYKGITLGCGKCAGKGGRKGTGKKSMIRNDILTLKKK
jgi:hypothetical protein